MSTWHRAHLIAADGTRIADIATQRSPYLVAAQARTTLGRTVREVVEATTAEMPDRTTAPTTTGAWWPAWLCAPDSGLGAPVDTIPVDLPVADVVMVEVEVAA